MERWITSSKRNPCPICGRVKDSDCRQRADGQMVFCHRGSTLAPPDGLKKGDVLTDDSGRQWAYTGESRNGERDGAVFVIHKERAPTQLASCVSPEPAERVAGLKGSEACIITTYVYRQDLKVLRFDFTEEKKKTFHPQFFVNNSWNLGSGPEIWPFYGSIGSNGEDCIIEVEGEKCVDVLRTQGIAAISHPGHQRDQKSCTERYKLLAGSGIRTVYYISDNDAPGRKKAAMFAREAEAAGLEFNIIPAELIWADLPEGGSVDDMPPEQLTTLLPAAIKTSAGVKPAPIDRTSYEKLKKALQAFYEKCNDSSADAAAGIADIAASHGASVYDAKRIWDSLEEDRDVAAEALSATNAIAKRQELEEKRNRISLDDYLPHEVSRAVEELTGNLACDPLAAISVVLTTAAGVFRSGHRLDAGDGLFVKEPVIWMLLAGSSGSGKSPVMRHLCRDRLRLVTQHYNKVTEEVFDQWHRRSADTPKNRRTEEPDALRTCVTNFTTESLNGIIGDNHQQGLGTFIYSEEVKEILGNFDEYKSRGKGRGREEFLCLFDGNVNSQHRVGRKSKTIVGKVQNALLGAVQPGVFRGMVEQGDDAGLFARCLIVPLPNRYVEPNFFRTPAEITAVHLAEQSLENFYLRCLSLDASVLRLDPDAINMFVVLSRDTYDKTQRVSLESQRAVYGKRLGYILQVALTMHLIRVAAGEEDPKTLYVTKQTLARAVLFVDLLQSYAIVEQQESQMQQHGTFDLNRRIHSYAKARDGATAREFSTSCIPSRLRKSIKSFHVRAAMEQLVEMGLGEWRGKRSSHAQTGEIFAAIGKFPD